MANFVYTSTFSDNTSWSQPQPTWAQQPFPYVPCGVAPVAPIPVSAGKKPDGPLDWLLGELAGVIELGQRELAFA